MFSKVYGARQASRSVMRFRHTFEEQSGFSARSSALSQRRRRLFSPCHAPTAIAMQFRLTNDRQARSFSASSTLKLPSNEPFRTHLPVKHSEPTVHSFYHKSTSTFSYVVAGSPHDAESGVLDVVIIDSVLDYDAASGSVTTESADGLMSFCAAQNYRVTAVLETHAHADHLSAGFYISRSLHVGHLNFAVNPPLIIGKGIEEVQRRFAPRYGLTQDDLHGSFDLLIDEKMNLRVGNSRINAIHLPGHTSDHMGYKIGENIFTGDVVFLPDVGSARADFPGGSADLLRASIHRLLDASPQTRLYVGHDYPPPSRADPKCFSTIYETQHENVHLKNMDDFVQRRLIRDKELAAPRLLHPSLQVNIRGGRLPPPGPDGVSKMQIPLTAGTANLL